MAHVTPVYVALGSNLGAREQNLDRALARLCEKVELHARSRIYETEPWGPVAQPRFLNQVVAGETDLSAPELLRWLKQIEWELGRRPGIRYGPRVIDLDILVYDDLVLTSPELTLPHPRLDERRFVLVPLAEVAPQLVPPGMKLTVRQLLARLPDDSTVWPYQSGSETGNSSTVS